MIDNTGLPDEGHDNELLSAENEQLWIDLKAVETLDKPVDKPKFAPTEDQAEGLRLMTEWFQSNSARFFVLRGYAGTGKTFSITELVNRGIVKPTKVVFTAPTNKAVKVLRASLSDAGVISPTKTIYSLLGLTMAANGEIKEITSPDPEAIDLSELDLVIVDEASMVNSMLMREIEKAAKRFNLPFLFMGDPAQLPPVGEDASPIWKLPDSFTLTKVMRYGNSILDLATAIRNVVDHPAPSVQITQFEPVFVHKRPDFDLKILAHLEDLKAGDAKVICWRNVTVAAYNGMIRSAIYGAAEARSNPFLPGDKIVATEPCNGLEKDVLMRTDEEAVVERVVVSKHPFYPEYECYRILARREDNSLCTLFSLTELGAFDFNNKLNELSAAAKTGARIKWREFWALKETFHQIRPSYAITSHRSQGSSYQIVFVDRMDIMLNKTRREAFRSLYVACTRARKEVHIC